MVETADGDGPNRGAKKKLLISMPQEFGAWAELHRSHLANDKRFLGMLRRHGGQVSLSSIFQVAAKIGLEWMDAEYGVDQPENEERDSAQPRK